jgi:hypothetical protein
MNDKRFYTLLFAAGAASTLLLFDSTAPPDRPAPTSGSVRRGEYPVRHGVTFALQPQREAGQRRSGPG